MTRTHHAFTLIELLIVVAILAVLAAAATVNFMDAHTRSKVTRTQSDLRTIATALEVYRVDTNGYPVVASLYMPLDERLAPLTTPIAYLSSLPVDPFYKAEADNSISGSQPYYVYASGNLYAGAADEFDSFAFHGTIYSLAGRGPDEKITFGGYCMAHPRAIRSGAPIRGAYDPTNGTVSAGDILRLGSGRVDDGM